MLFMACSRCAERSSYDRWGAPLYPEPVPPAAAPCPVMGDRLLLRGWLRDRSRGEYDRRVLGLLERPRRGERDLSRCDSSVSAPGIVCLNFQDGTRVTSNGVAIGKGTLRKLGRIDRVPCTACGSRP